jgi:hypothetical protein
MGDERYLKMAWQARIQRRDTKDDLNRLEKQAYRIF